MEDSFEEMAGLVISLGWMWALDQSWRVISVGYHSLAIGEVHSVVIGPHPKRLIAEKLAIKRCTNDWKKRKEGCISTRVTSVYWKTLAFFFCLRHRCCDQPPCLDTVWTGGKILTLPRFLKVQKVTEKRIL